MGAATTLASIRRQLRELAESLDDAPLEEIVEVGTVLAAIEHIAKTELAGVKGTLRSEAQEDLDDAPGTVHFDGLDIGRVSITIPNPKVSLVKGTDPEVLRRELGDEFDIYFETKITHAPRQNATNLAAKMATGRSKDLLLCSIEEKEQTPRVSFRRV